MADYPPVTARVLPEGTWTHPGTGMVFAGDITMAEAIRLREQGQILGCPHCASQSMPYTDPDTRERRVRVLHQGTCPIYQAAERAAREE